MRPFVISLQPDASALFNPLTPTSPAPPNLVTHRFGRRELATFRGAFINGVCPVVTGEDSRSAVAIGARGLPPLIAPGAVAGGSGGFALVEARSLARFSPHPRTVAGRTGNHAEPATFGAFGKLHFQRSRRTCRRF
jgi:hypothetical protein